MKAGNISRRLTAVFCFMLVAGSTAGWCSQAVDNSVYAGLLGKYVKNGVVDYAGLKSHEAEVDRYRKLLEQTDTRTLAGNERLAFYINAYNINAIKIVLTGYPGIHSIKDRGSIFGSVWSRQVFTNGGKPLSLDEIENKIIRPGFHDPRVHFAVNCASKSCPPLRSEPYSGKLLDLQLDSAARAFLNNPRSNYLRGNTLFVSKILDWYAGDFRDGVLAFVMKYANPDLKKKLEDRAGRIEIEYLPYDWTLNGK